MSVGKSLRQALFCRLKDVRRVATHYDRIVPNYLATVCLAAISYRYESPP